MSEHKTENDNGVVRVKHVSDSETEQTYLLMHKHINGSGRLFGGQLVSWIDEVAGIVGRRHSQCNVVTACIDNLRFKAGVYLNDTVVVRGKISYVGRSSMEVRVDTYKEDMKGMRTMINRAFVVMVALDENEKPTRVPHIFLETEAQRAEWEAGAKRAALRKMRQHEGF